MPKGAFLRFRVHQFQLGGKHYLLLPKLNSSQVEVLAKRFAEIGVVTRGALLVVNSRQGPISVSDAGLCWSSFDPGDVVLPAVPNLLSCPKEDAQMETVKARYLRTSRSQEGTTVRVLPRLESSSLWRELRASGGCALAPDEHAVVSTLLRGARRKCEMVTDFFVGGSVPLVYGRKRYFGSKLGPDEAALTLRVAGERGLRNSYVPNDGALGPISASALRRRNWLDLFGDLGEWCPFEPV